MCRSWYTSLSVISWVASHAEYRKYSILPRDCAGTFARWHFFLLLLSSCQVARLGNWRSWITSWHCTDHRGIVLPCRRRASELNIYDVYHYDQRPKQNETLLKSIGTQLPLCMSLDNLSYHSIRMFRHKGEACYCIWWYADVNGVWTRC